MEDTPYLIFLLSDSFYAVEAAEVIEIVPLPELIPLDETPSYIAGVADLHGRLVTVIDLNRRLGHQPQRFSLKDFIVVLGHGGSTAGIVVNGVQNVCDIAAAEIEPMPSFGAGAAPCDVRFLAGFVKSGGHVLMIIHLENLLSLSRSLEDGSGAAGSVLPDHWREGFCPDATAQERIVFRERSLSLARRTDTPYSAGLLPVAVVRLGDELFGIGLETIREFAELRNVTPVPCCPAHVLGQMNLRGDLITLTSIVGVLGLQETHPYAFHTSKIVVLNSDELRAGVLVDEVLEVAYLRMTDITPPVPAEAHTSGREYFRGTSPLGTRVVTLLDLPKLLTMNSLTVDEEP